MFRTFLFCLALLVPTVLPGPAEAAPSSCVYRSWRCHQLRWHIVAYHGCHVAIVDLVTGPETYAAARTAAYQARFPWVLFAYQPAP